MNLWNLSLNLILLGFCHSLEMCLQKNLFSTKTAYKVVGNINTNISIPRKCEPVQVNMVHRHGHRYPSAKDVRKINEIIRFLNINQAKSKYLKENPYKVEEDKMLNIVGQQELFAIGKRLKARYPQIFHESYTPLKYKFESSCKSRSLQSSSSLAAGIFLESGPLEHGYQPIAVETRPCDNDLVLRFFDKCSKYIKQVEDSDASTYEMNAFGKSEPMQNVARKVSERLGLISGDKLQAKHLKSLYLLCAYEMGIHKGNLTTGYCSLFDNDDLNAMEYYMDLKHFYKRSAGFDITYKSSCPLLNDIVYSLKQAVIDSTEGKQTIRGIFRSSHAETILPLFALIGVHLDEQKLTAQNYDIHKSRQFRGACTSPFSGNLYFVLFKCADDAFKIQMYVNEWQVNIPGCSELDCDFNEFLKLFGELPCNFQQMCNVYEHKADL